MTQCRRPSRGTRRSGCCYRCLPFDALGSRAGASFVKQSRLACTCFYAFVTGPVRTPMILRSMPDDKRSAEGALEPLVEILGEPGRQQRH